jgi:hypothetical protein
MSKVKCATVLKAKEVRNDAEGKRAEIPKAKCGKVKRAGRARAGPTEVEAADVRALLCVSLLQFFFFVHPQRNFFSGALFTATFTGHRHIYGPLPPRALAEGTVQGLRHGPLPARAPKAPVQGMLNAATVSTGSAMCASRSSSLARGRVIERKNKIKWEKP